VPALVPARGRPPVALERVPWSVLGPEFYRMWSKDENGRYQPQHLEILGQSGSGKTFWLAQVLTEMVRRRKSAVILIATKPADKTVREMGWPVTDSWREVQQHDQVIFWPRSSKTGVARKRYQAAKIKELLDNLWEPEANTIVVFDEIKTAEDMDPDIRSQIEMYLREGRSQGIVVVGGKQRGQRVVSDMHSETSWTVVFSLKTLNDREYAAGILGGKTEWLPVLESLSKARHEFVIQGPEEGDQFISWIDQPVDVKQVAKSTAGYRR
jgi:nucleoside-triphosphatase THEP1